MRWSRHRVIPLLLCAALLAGCRPDAARPLVTPPGSNLPPPVPLPSPIPLDQLQQIIEAYATRKSWSKNGTGGGVYIPDVIDRLKGFFVRRRIPVLHLANPSWVNESGFTQLFNRLDAEVGAVEAFLTTTMPPILDGTDGPPTHLDLADLAKVKVTTPNGRIRQRKAEYLKRRKKRINTIVWRAAGIHESLWDPASAATLRTAALEQVLDMRLHMAERINLQISSARALLDESDKVERTAFKTNNQPQGPWKDGFRVRMFEYPRIPASLQGVVGAANIAEWNAPAGSVRDWKWEDSDHTRMHWIKSSDGKIRMPATTNAQIDPDWTGKPEYDRYLLPNATGGPAAAIDRLFTPHEDWWERSWLFCDHVIAALQIDGLRFALRRRLGDDTAFNALPARIAPSYVMLTPNLAGDKLYDDGHLMNDIANDPYFDKLRVLDGELQVGDQLIMWNNFLYGMISNGEWRLENALVMDVDADPVTGAFDPTKLRMQGHGTGERNYIRYQDTIAREAQKGMVHTQNVIKKAVAANAAVPEVDLHRGAKAVRWDPYEAFDKPGAWWVRVEVPDTSSDNRWATVSEALIALPKSVADQTPNVGAGYHPPPMGGLTDAVFFPIFEPKLRDGSKGWDAYFAARRNGPSNSLPKKLQLVKIDGSMCPGLYFKGAGTQIPIVRPKVIP